MGKASLKMFGGTHIDYIHVEGTTANHDASLVNKYIPVLNQNTILLLTFDGDTGIKGTGLLGNLEGYTYTVYREDLTKGTTMNYVATITNGNLTVTDYNIVNNHQYQYLVFVETEDYICNPQETDIINTCWGQWELIGLKNTENSNEYRVDTDNIWQLNLDLESAEQIQNIEKIEYKNLTRFPKISQGEINYVSGTISCLLGQLNNEGHYIESAEILEQWRDFIDNAELKLLKDRKGHSYIVQTMSSSNTTKDETMEQMNVISFGWTQVKNVTGLVITESAGDN